MDRMLLNLPIIDWSHAIKLAGNKKEYAEEMLELFIKSLSNDVAAIKKFYVNQNYIEMFRLVHKLHGAVCYCGLPRLKAVIVQLETNLKNNIMDDLPHFFSAFEVEVKLLLEHYSLLI